MLMLDAVQVVDDLEARVGPHPVDDGEVGQHGEVELGVVLAKLEHVVDPVAVDQRHLVAEVARRLEDAVGLAGENVEGFLGHQMTFPSLGIRSSRDRPMLVPSW